MFFFDLFLQNSILLNILDKIHNFYFIFFGILPDIFDIFFTFNVDLEKVIFLNMFIKMIVFTNKYDILFI